MLRFAEELLILTVDTENREPVNIPQHTLSYALAGAVLMDLALENRIDTDVEALIVINSTPVGDSLLDMVLTEINQEPNTLPTQSWMSRIAKRADELHALALDRLVTKNILEIDEGGVFSLSRWVSRSRRYPTVDGTAEQEIQSRMIGILLSDDIPSPRDSVIISLAHACGVFQRILEKSEYEEVKERIELISRLELVTRSVTEAIRTISLSEVRTLQRVARERTTSEWPQASGRLPVVGHAFKLVGDLSTFCTEQYLKHGPVFEVDALGRKMVVIAGQEANVFMNKEGKFHLRTRELWQHFSNSVGAANLLIGLDGADHRQLRKMKRRGYSKRFILDRMPEVVAVVDRELSELPFDRPLSVIHVLQRVMTEQITLLAASSSCRDYIDDLRIFSDAMHLVFVNRQYPKFIMRMPRIRRARRRLEMLIEQVLAEHESKSSTEKPEDLVDDLIELHRSAPAFMPETDMFINAMGPFLVGLDTVASATSFAFHALLKHPDVLDRVRIEADNLFADPSPTEEGIRRMTTTQRVIMETLRIYPIAQVLSRTVTNSFEFAGYRIPAGTQLLIANSVTHKLPEFFPDPDRFDIDRYSPERREHVQPGVFAPYGLGHHGCLGRGFAEIQMILTLTRFLHRTEIALESPGYRLKTKYSPVPKPHRNFKIRLQQRK